MVGHGLNGRDLLDHETLKLGVFHKWFDESIADWLNDIYMVIDPTSRNLGRLVIKVPNFKIFSFCILYFLIILIMYDYHIPQLKSIAIPAMAFSPHNFTILPKFHMKFFRIGNLTFFFEIELYVNFNYYY